MTQPHQPRQDRPATPLPPPELGPAHPPQPLPPATAELDTIRTGLNPEQECRAQAARAIGWQHPSDTDPAVYDEWWWAELDRLATWIRIGARP